MVKNQACGQGSTFSSFIGKRAIQPIRDSEWYDDISYSGVEKWVWLGYLTILFAAFKP
jgi:hypothetical protein